MRDEIIEELWRIKDEIAKEYHYDLDALAAALRQQQQESGRKVVNLEKQAADQDTPMLPAQAPSPKP